VVYGLGLAALVGVVGCEKLPWSSKARDSGTATAALTTAQHAAAPAKPAVLPSETLAVINAVPISKTDIELRLQELKMLVETSGGQWGALSREEVEAVLDELVNTELMSQDTVARGLDRSLDVQRRWEYLRRGFFAQEWVKWNRERLNVPPEDIERYYETNKGGYGIKVPARARLRQLIVDSEDQANKALAQLHGGAVDFESLAKQISLGPTAAQGGLLPNWVMRANEKALFYPTEADAAKDGVISLDPILEAAAFAIDGVNHVSNYVKGSDNRYHIFQLVERQEEHLRDKREVWDQIKAYLEAQKLKTAIEELRSKAALERFPERLEGAAQ